jgi:hypothetical protein
MSTSTTSLSDTLPSTVPKLDSNGQNWAIFHLRFTDAIEAKGFWGHYDGSTPCPTLPGEPVPTPGDRAAHLTALSQWEKDERSAKTLLTQKLPDSTLLKIRLKKSVKERWEAVVKEYTEKGEFVKTDLKGKFLMMKFVEKGGNARDFLDGLRVKKEELAEVGVTITDEEYLSTIISSLPESLANFASGQLAYRRSSSSAEKMQPDLLLSLLIEEADRQKLHRARRQGSGKGKSEEKDEALVAESSKFKTKGKKKVECWNCGETGHFKNKCTQPKKVKPQTESKEKDKGKGAANVAEANSEEDGAWAAEAVEIVDAERNGGRGGDQDWFVEIADAIMEQEPGEVSDVPEDFGDTSGLAFTVMEPIKTKGTTELYDSGCTNHISPY